MKTIKEEWEGFEANVVPKNAPEKQRSEMRMAFYAGAWTVFCMTQRMGEPDISEQEAMNHLDEIKRECEAFTIELMKRYAEKN